MISSTKKAPQADGQSMHRCGYNRSERDQLSQAGLEQEVCHNSLQSCAAGYGVRFIGDAAAAFRPLFLIASYLPTFEGQQIIHQRMLLK